MDRSEGEYRMTQWVENPTGGRDRGPRALARAWLEVMVRPRQFFRVGVGPGDQAPGLTFLMTVVLVSETSRFLLVADAYPSLPVARPLAGVFWIGLVVLLVAPLSLHLTAAIQTGLLLPLVSDRAGISETVQVLAYATAPCVFAGIPIPALRVVCVAYGTILLVIGLQVVHRTTFLRAALAATLPAILIFGTGFRGGSALADLGIVLGL